MGDVSMQAVVESQTYSKGVADFLARTGRLLINNRWVEPEDGSLLPVEHPANGKTVAMIGLAGPGDVDKAVAAARQGFKRWSAMSSSSRAGRLFRMADLIEHHIAEFAELEALDVGKPLAVARMVDVPFTIETLRYNAGWATKLTGESFELASQGSPFQAGTIRQPIGVVAGIVPWNFPLLQAVMKLSAALAAGCVVILKPSEVTPLSALRLGELAIEAGFPPGVLQVLSGTGPEAGAALVAHPGVDKVSFTGSTAVGREVVRNCAQDFKRVTVELGGKSPNIVFADADLPKAIAGAVQAAFFNAGQVCYAGTRLYVEASVYEQVLQGLVTAASGLKLGDPFALDTQVGPLVSAAQLSRVLGFVDAGRSEGARVLYGGSRLDSPGHFMSPTILADVHEEMTVMREEIFGPVVCVSPFKDVKDVIAKANDSRYGLAAGVWSSDARTAQIVARALQVGTVWINSYHTIDPHMPFGGWRQSGWGREFGRIGVESYTELKSIAMKL
jgi:phenylacetaldehyde dehydrogenase